MEEKERGDDVTRRRSIPVALGASLDRHWISQDVTPRLLLLRKQISRVESGVSEKLSGFPQRKMSLLVHKKSREEAKEGKDAFRFGRMSTVAFAVASLMTSSPTTHRRRPSKRHSRAEHSNRVVPLKMRVRFTDFSLSKIDWHRHLFSNQIFKVRQPIFTQ